MSVSLEDLYKKVFREREHYLTTVRQNKPAYRKRIKRVNQLTTAVNNQPLGSHLYITKYPEDGVIDTIILDFDDDLNPNRAFLEAETLKKYLHTKHINCVIVDSTNKGVHAYIEVPPLNFKRLGLSVIEKPKLLFNHYVHHLINMNHFKFETLDMINFSASLNGNIRLIGSTHPKTGKTVKIKCGEFVTDYESYYKKSIHYSDIIWKNAWRLYNKDLEELKEKKLRRESNPVDKLDLRDIFRTVFNVDNIKEYSGGYWCNCPFHNDSNPSFCVTEDYYFCAGCGAKGNVWTLIKDGYIELPQINYIKTPRVK